jgi:hypothetical protein
MKKRERFILAALVLVLVAALVAQAIMSGGLSGFTKDPNVAALLAQATTPDTQDQSGLCIEKASPAGKTTDRHAFLEGALFGSSEITKMQNEALRSALEHEDTLAGLEGVTVVVEDVNPKVEKYGLTRQLLQTDTELRLRQHGIRIFTNEEAKQSIAEQYKKWEETLSAKTRSVTESLAQQEDYFLRALRDLIQHEGMLRASSVYPPYLHIKVSTSVSEEAGVAALSIHVKLGEVASLCRNGAGCGAAIWEEGAVGVSSLSHLKEKVREALRDRVDEFINAYLAANPKDRSPQSQQ